VTGRLLGLSPFTAVAASPAVSIGLIASTSILAPLLGLPWTVGTLAISTLLLWALTAACRFLFRRFTAEPDQETLSQDRVGPLPWPAHREGLWYVATAILALGLTSLQFVGAIPSPALFSQTFDNVFHLNAVRWILDTGDASSLSLTSMTTAGEPPYFYPATWHAFTALVAMSGSDIPTTVNAANIAICGAAWPLSCFFLLRQLKALTPPTIAGAGVLVCSFGSFPLLLLDWGVLYPNLLSLALIPAGLGLVAVVLGLAPAARLTRPAACALLLLAGPAIAVAHPNGAMSLVALTLPALVIALVVGLRRRVRAIQDDIPAPTMRIVGSYLLGVLVLAGGTLALTRLWETVRPPAAAATWDRKGTVGDALRGVLLNAPFDSPPAWFLSALVLTGLLWSFGRVGTLWLALAFTVAAALFVVCAGVGMGPFRTALTGVWYNDAYRLAALLPVVAAPLAVLGLDVVLRAFGRLLRSIPVTRTPVAKTAAGAAVVLLLVPVAFLTDPMTAARRGVADAYGITTGSVLVTSDEYAIIGMIDNLVDRNETIAVNPWTGGATAYALTGRNTTYKHVLSNKSADDVLIDMHLKDSDTVPGVCEAVQRRNIRYVLDFGRQEILFGNNRYPGFEEIESDPDFTVVASRGQASLYRFDGCTS
jgi:hypothetical protein